MKIIYIFLLLMSTTCAKAEFKIGDCLESRFNGQIDMFRIEIIGETKLKYLVNAYWLKGSKILITYFIDKKLVQKQFVPVKCEVKTNE